MFVGAEGFFRVIIGLMRWVAFVARSEQSSNGFCLFPNLLRVLKTRRAWNQALQFVTVGDDDEHLVNQIMGEHAMR